MRRFDWRWIATAALLLTALPVLLVGSSVRGKRSYPDDLRISQEWLAGLGQGSDAGQGIADALHSLTAGRTLRLPHTRAISDSGQLANLISFQSQPILDAESALGHPIQSAEDPVRDLFFATQRLFNSTLVNQVDQTAAEEMLDILLGRTRGRIYDGHPLLNFNRHASDRVDPSLHIPPGSEEGEFKMRAIRWTGEREASWKEDGTLVNVWEVDVNMLWYKQQMLCDTFLIKIPHIDPESGLTPSPDDTLRIHYSIRSLIEEEFAPDQFLRDADLSDSQANRPGEGFLYKAQDTVWRLINPATLSRVSVQHTALRFIEGIYIWGWNLHPPRIHFIQPVREVRNVHSGEIEWSPRSRSFVERTRGLSLDSIGDAAPEKKLYQAATAALEGVDAASLRAMLDDPAQPPLNGTWREWVALMDNQRELPPEAIQSLQAEGLGLEDFDFVLAYANNELYGDSVSGHTLRSWSQGDILDIKVINLDRHTHYYQAQGAGPPLDDSLRNNFEDAVFSFEIASLKPYFGAPKTAELQWRAGWGFRSGYSILQQDSVFPRQSDRRFVQPVAAPSAPGGSLRSHFGYQYSSQRRGGDFAFDPPAHYIGTPDSPALESLYDLSGFPFRFFDGFFLRLALANWEVWKGIFPGSFQEGLVIGRRTPGFGSARMCPGNAFPGDCTQDLSRFHWKGELNWPEPSDPDVAKNQLRFPAFLRNPDGGDIIPGTPRWRPFLYLSPESGSLQIDPDRPSQGHWTDSTFAHGAPIPPGRSRRFSIEAPRANAQLLAQFDGLFKETALFSVHPTDFSNNPPR